MTAGADKIDPLRNWVEGQSFCVTGGTGLIGRALVEALRNRGAKDITIASRKRDDTPDVRWLTGDLADSSFDLAPLPKHSIVFHLAGWKHAGQAALDTARCFDVNARGTWILLEAARQAHAARFIYASTWMVYGVPHVLPVAEDHPTNPNSIYASSKLAGEAAVCGYSKQFGMSTIIARLGNVYGGEADPETVWGRIVMLAARGEEIALRSLSSARDYLHVEDAAEGLIRLAAATNEPSCEIVNLGTARATKVVELAEMAAHAAGALTGRTPAIPIPPAAAPEPIPEFALCTRRLRKVTGWEPSVRLEDGMARCLERAIKASGR